MTASSLFRPLALCVCLSSLATLTHADERVGTLKNMEGEVHVIRSGKSLPAAPGGDLQEADRIVTGPNSAAAAILGDGSVVSVGPNSSMDITHYAFDSTTQVGSLLLGILQGTMRLVTGQMAKTNPDLVKVTTPTAVVGVRGTDFIVEAQP